MIFKKDIERFFVITGLQKNVNFLDVLIYFFHPRLTPVGLLRIANWLYCAGLGRLSKLVVSLNFFLFGIEATPRTKIGGGLFFPHTSGIVIGAESIGENVTIYQGVTLGAKNLDMSFRPETRPRIDNDVIIGAGAKVLGGVHIGAFSVIGANAVVLSDVPANSVALGVPAKIRNIDSK